MAKNNETVIKRNGSRSQTQRLGKWPPRATTDGDESRVTARVLNRKGERERETEKGDRRGHTG